MSIVTYDDLSTYSPYLSDEGVRIAKSRATKNLFLSHSFSDMRHARNALAVLKDHGANVYVDIEDGGLRAAATSADVAMRLKQAIESCKRLVVVVTENTHTSRWIPWEVGLADAFSGSSRIALLPLKPTATASELWINQEYFDLYPRIERARLADYTPYWAVRMPSGQYWSLRAWLDYTRPH